MENDVGKPGSFLLDNSKHRALKVVDEDPIRLRVFTVPSEQMGVSCDRARNRIAPLLGHLTEDDDPSLQRS